ncbi:hypothetical protein BC643_4344 [Mangrovibacterium diazotrophicum]|uniref:Uncharacterized protein n=1 Tax=Mangrovibacterium diazotrophicum TaxID=1261403 RepID=A0A419VV69_9BACT|nr:hypothetical protein BC643_4344 [Mangrovibacterium diazotrophicum]
MVFQVAINELERLILKTAEAGSCSRKIAKVMPAMPFKKSGEKNGFGSKK